jgi:hypothetical protein
MQRLQLSLDRFPAQRNKISLKSRGCAKAGKKYLKNTEGGHGAPAFRWLCAYFIL